MTLKKTTIVIPAYNEEDVIRRSLERIIEEKLPDNYEVVFVDDGSDDRTPEIISEFPVKAYPAPC